MKTYYFFDTDLTGQKELDICADAYRSLLHSLHSAGAGF